MLKTLWKDNKLQTRFYEHKSKTQKMIGYYGEKGVYHAWHVWRPVLKIIVNVCRKFTTV